MLETFLFILQGISLLPALLLWWSNSSRSSLCFEGTSFQMSSSSFFVWNSAISVRVCDWASINEGSNLYQTFPMILGNKAEREWLCIKTAAILYLSMLCSISIGWNVESFEFYCFYWVLQFVVTVGKPRTSSVALSLHWRWRWNSFWQFCGCCNVLLPLIKWLGHCW